MVITLELQLFLPSLLYASLFFSHIAYYLLASYIICLSIVCSVCCPLALENQFQVGRAFILFHPLMGLLIPGTWYLLNIHL